MITIEDLLENLDGSGMIITDWNLIMEELAFRGLRLGSTINEEEKEYEIN